MKDLYRNILTSIPLKAGADKYEAISGMEDILRCRGFPEEGKPIFAKLQEYLLTEIDLKAQALICDALYEGMLSEYDDSAHIEGLEYFLESGDSMKMCMALDVLGGSVSDSYRDIIERFLNSENSDVREAAAGALGITL